MRKLGESSFKVWRYILELICIHFNIYIYICNKISLFNENKMPIKDSISFKS